MNMKCLCNEDKKCSDCGKHEVSVCIAASEDGSVTKFLGYEPIGTNIKRD